MFFTGELGFKQIVGLQQRVRHIRRAQVVNCIELGAGKWEIISCSQWPLLQSHQPTSCLKNNLRIKMVALGPPLSWLLRPSSDRVWGTKDQRLTLRKRAPKHQTLQSRWKYMWHDGKSVSVSIKYGGFQGDQIAKSGPSLARRYTLFIFPEKKIEMLLY